MLMGSQIPSHGEERFATERAFYQMISRHPFIVGRFCEPINPPVNFYMRNMFIEYRIVANATNAKLWCKIKGYFNTDISSQGFFCIFPL
jgi:hypothetical protein